jgi:hypothetical protein
VKEPDGVKGIALVIINLMNQDETFGMLFWGAMYKVCPFLEPRLVPHVGEGMSQLQHRKELVSPFVV